MVVLAAAVKVEEGADVPSVGGSSSGLSARGGECDIVHNQLEGTELYLNQEQPNSSPHLTSPTRFRKWQALRNFISPTFFINLKRWRTAGRGGEGVTAQLELCFWWRGEAG